MDNSHAPGFPLGPHDPVRLGRYSLLRRLGEGGMGTVYLGRTADGRRVAIKVIRREFAQVEEFRRRFTREADSARQVRRFCTAEVLDVGTEGDQPYLVTEFVEGPTLSQVIAEGGPLSAANLEGLAVGVAVALTAIHGAGIVHRDLKPGNVMLSPYGLRVIDFGIARASDAVQATQMRVGTPAFMAPEQVLDTTLTPALDVFAWGAVVAYAGTGRLPFGEGEGLFERILTAPPALDGLRGSDLLPLVEHAMAKDPAHRPTAGDLVARLTGSTRGGAGGGIGVADAAVTRMLGVWPGADGVPETVAAADLPSDPQRTPVEPPTAATVLPAAGSAAPVSSTRSVPRPPRTVPPPHTGGRVPAAPPVRTSDTPVPATADPAAARPTRGGRRRWLVLALVVVVVIAAAVVGGVLLFGDDTNRTPSGAGTTPPGTRSPGASSPTVALPAPIPRSTALGLTTLVARRSGDGGGALVALTTDGSAPAAIGDATPARLPSVSPDRASIAYLGTGGWRLAGADGRAARPLFVGAAAALQPCAGSRIGWSPDGSQVVVCATGPDGAGLYTANVTTGAIRKLAAQARSGDPAWSPNGALILYWSAAQGAGGPIYTVPADGSGAPKRVTDGVDSQPAWAPNGGHIVFRRAVDGGSGIWGTRADGSGLFDFTQKVAAGDVASPSYAPSGQTERIVFAGAGSGTWQIYVFDPAKLGEGVTALPGQAGGDVEPTFSAGPPQG